MSRVSIALSLVAAVAAVTPAAAADMYGSQRGAPAANYGYSDNGGGSAASQWNGGYAGGQVGYGWGHDDQKGAQGGIYGGFNAAVGSNVVVGVEGDVNLSGQESNSVVGGSLVTRKSDWNASLRARAGVAYDKIMPYATLGIAFADDTAKGFGANDTTTKVGYVVGGGVEGRVSDRVSLKGEVVHMGFSGTDHVTGGTAVPTDVSTTLVRAGAAYRF